jgi:hypothetical protein
MSFAHLETTTHQYVYVIAYITSAVGKIICAKKVQNLDRNRSCPAKMGALADNLVEVGGGWPT